LKAAVLAALAGVGDPQRGEWWEHGIAMHLRRRLSVAEDLIIGPAVDIRGTPEQMQRYRRVQIYLPPGMQEPL
jgi:hypothetical protein